MCNFLRAFLLSRGYHAVTSKRRRSSEALPRRAARGGHPRCRDVPAAWMGSKRSPLQENRSEVQSSFSRARAGRRPSCRAMKLGASDFVSKPSTNRSRSAAPPRAEAAVSSVAMRSLPRRWSHRRTTRSVGHHQRADGGSARSRRARGRHRRHGAHSRRKCTARS